MESLMQNDWPLVVSKIIDFAATWHGDQKVICRTTEGPIVESTYKKVWVRSAQCALALSRLGVAPGDRVATLAWNTTRHLETWYGIAGMGGVCHTVNPRLFEHDIEYILNDAGDVVIMADITFVPILERLIPHACSSIKHVILLTDRDHMPKNSPIHSLLLCYEDWISAEEEPILGKFQWYPSKETDACGLCYTSGTTGRPKGVLYGHRSNFLHALSVCLPDGFNLKSTSCFLMVVPMFHANSWGTAFSLPLVGGKLVLPGPRLDGQNICRLIDRYRVTHSGGVPTVWQSVKDYIERTEFATRLESLRILVISGAACPSHLIDFFQNIVKAEVRHSWGMTELSPKGTFGTRKDSIPVEHHRTMQATQGRPHIFCEPRLVDDSGRLVPHDGTTPGSLQVRGPAVIKRYFNKTEDCVQPGGWFDSGDIATIDTNGYIVLRDRSKDVIKSGGEWISSIEIENIVSGHANVAEAAVIAIPHPKWGERPLLVVVRKKDVPPVTKEELLQFLRGKIASWWMPDDVAFVDSLPYTATGKISKRHLREQFPLHPQSSKL